MLPEVLHYRLNHLFYDLRCSNRDLLGKLYLYNLTEKDRREILKQMYETDYLPVKVNKVSKQFCREGISVELMDEFIDGFDKYLKSQEYEIDKFIRNNQIAVKIFLHILELDPPECNVLYLLFFKKMPPQSVIESLYMSRSTLFRLRRSATANLLAAINNDSSFPKDC